MDTLQELQPIARKKHRCDYCTQQIEVGEKYNYSTHANYGDIYAFKSHIKCDKLAHDMDMFDPYGDGLTGDEFTEIVIEHYREKNPNRIPNAPFSHVLEWVIEERKLMAKAS
jgi:hypothetical protein